MSIAEEKHERKFWLRQLYRFPPLLWSIRWILCRLQIVFLHFYKEKNDVDFVASVFRTVRSLVQPNEMYVLMGIARMQSQLPGDMAELGVFQGATAKIICHVKGARHFFGFDTFEGLPDVSAEDGYAGIHFFRRGQFSAPMERVSQYLGQDSTIHLLPGEFPNSAQEAIDRQFSFVHLDADLYQGTKEGLAFFWERMVEHGMILIHDSNANGVKKAIAEFCAIHQPLAFPLNGSHFLIRKCGGSRK